MKTSLPAARVGAILDSLPGGRVVVVGDAMLDVFVFGEVSRISPEAPVPVVRVTRETERLGGAANVALNVTSLGGRATLVGVAGDDLAAVRLLRATREQGVAARLVPIAGRPTTVKTRVMAHQHQMVRTDHEVEDPIGPAVETRLMGQIAQVLKKGSALIVSDYHKGVVTRSFMRALIGLARERAARLYLGLKGAEGLGLYEELVKHRDGVVRAVGLEGLRLYGLEPSRQATRDLIENERDPLPRVQAARACFRYSALP